MRSAFSPDVTMAIPNPGIQSSCDESHPFINIYKYVPLTSSRAGVPKRFHSTTHLDRYNLF